MTRNVFGIGKGATDIIGGLPWYLSHPGKLRPGATPDPTTGEYTEADYEIAPGMIPRTLAEAYSVYSTPTAPYPHARVAPLTGLQRRAHDIVSTPREDLDIASRSSLQKLMSSMDRSAAGAAEPYIRAATAPITAADRQSWVESVRRGVIRPLQEEMQQNLMERVLPAIDTQLIGTGNFRSPRRHMRHQQAVRDMNRDLMRETARALFEGERLGEEGAQKHMGRQMRAAEIVGGTHTSDLSRTIDAAKTAEAMIGEEQRRSIAQAGAIEAAGKTQQDQEQTALNIMKADFDREQAQKREDAAAKVAMARGIASVVPTSTTAMYPSAGSSSSIWSQLAGFGTGLMGLSMLRPNSVQRSHGGSVRAQHNDGGRVKRVGGGSILSQLTSSMDPMNMIREQMFNEMMSQPQPQAASIPNIPMPQPQAQIAPSDPLAEGAKTATQSHAAMKMDYHRQKMEEYANRLESPENTINPMGSLLARAGFKFMGSPTANFGQRLGEAMESGLDAYEGAIKTNQASAISQKERAMKIHEALLESHRIEEMDRVKREAEKDQNEALMKYRMDELGETKRHNIAMEGIAGQREANALEKALNKDKGKVAPEVKSALDAKGIPASELFSITDAEKEYVGKELPQLMEQMTYIKESKKHLDKGGPMGPGMEDKIGTILTSLDPKSKLSSRQQFDAFTKKIVLVDEFGTIKGSGNQKKHEDFMKTKAGLDKVKSASKDMLNLLEKNINDRLAIISFKYAAEKRLPANVVLNTIMKWKEQGGKGPISSYVPEEWKSVLPKEEGMDSEQKEAIPSVPTSMSAAKERLQQIAREKQDILASLQGKQ